MRNNKNNFLPFLEIFEQQMAEIPELQQIMYYCMVSHKNFHKLKAQFIFLEIEDRLREIRNKLYRQQE